MKELQGLNLIDRNGKYYGIIENSYYTNNSYVVQYHNFYGYKEEEIKLERVNTFKNEVKIRSDRYDIINNRNIQYIYHFSPIENTDNILKYGLVSREEARRQGIPLIITDPYRYDGELNRISASLSFPNYKMRWSLHQNNINVLIYEIDTRILLTKLDTQFYYTNAANSVFAGADKDYLTTNDAFLDMFYTNDRVNGLDISYPTDPQAEILVNNNIEKNYIREVISEYYDRMTEVMCKLNNINYEPKRYLYGPREDWKYWQNGN